MTRAGQPLLVSFFLTFSVFLHAAPPQPHCWEGTGITPHFQTLLSAPGTLGFCL